MNALKVPPLSERNLKGFWSKITLQVGGCWIWTGALNSSGYGNIKVAGRTYLATRVMMALHGKQSSLHVLHSCNNPLCVNPEHLRFGTDKENAGDRCRSGNNIEGSRSIHAKLTEADIPVIRRLRRDKFTLQYIADLVGVSNQVVSEIELGKKWRHITAVATDEELANWKDLV